ncbi:MAG: 50S ribosomal protein L25/general stress protein Ctc [Limimaricola sp.]|uniref:50S ribosomal protein L25/general stress protein Ctc n=1 Tax=Limimaricola sp. TaxID=2211665 RepID=UPI001D356EE6|nr:50S ribosomal protein L25/general stress protein Ctc [Limimaricola sp.]MBI1416000.1 50S ribosomal protein L25/general stress protein Ctc [Limimaricola sp.]
MAGKITDLHATVRTGTGKGAARQARRDGQVPGIIYGGGQDPVAINIPFDYLLARLRKGRFLATLFNLKVEGQPDAHVICRSVQRDVVKDLPVHIDFMRLTDSTRVNMFLPVEFVNHDKSRGIKRGGVLVVVRSEVEFNVRADSIPEHIVVDLDGTDFGDVIHISNVALPAGVKPVIDRDFVIANISAPTVMLSDDGAEDEAEEAEEA